MRLVNYMFVKWGKGFRVPLLLHVVDHLHEALAERVGLLHGLSLAIDADDGLGVRLT